MVALFNGRLNATNSLSAGISLSLVSGRNKQTLNNTTKFAAFPKSRPFRAGGGCRRAEHLD